MIAISACHLFGEPSPNRTRRGRSTAATTLPLETGSGSSSSVSVSENSGEEANVIAKLIENVMQEVTGDAK